MFGSPHRLTGRGGCPPATLWQVVVRAIAMPGGTSFPNQADSDGPTETGSPPPPSPGGRSPVRSTRRAISARATGRGTAPSRCGWSGAPDERNVDSARRGDDGGRVQAAGARGEVGRQRIDADAVTARRRPRRRRRSTRRWTAASEAAQGGVGQDGTGEDQADPPADDCVVATSRLGGSSIATTSVAPRAAPTTIGPRMRPPGSRVTRRGPPRIRRSPPLPRKRASGRAETRPSGEPPRTDRPRTGRYGRHRGDADDSQVLHERDEAAVRPELLGHQHHDVRPAGGQAPHGRRPGNHPRPGDHPSTLLAATVDVTTARHNGHSFRTVPRMAGVKELAIRQPITAIATFCGTG